MAVQKELLDILVCPESRAPLIYFAAGTADEQEFLFCPESRLRYRVDEGIPVMLVEEAERVDKEEAERLAVKAREIGLLED